MNLIIDIGNTRTKLALTNAADASVIERHTFAPLRAYELSAVLDDFDNQIGKAIVCATGIVPPVIIDILRRRVPYTLVMDPAHTEVPVINLYATPETLGQDRLAAAVGATVVCPGRNVLIVDFGTAITTDVVSARGEYLGGNISLGIDMRFRALNDYTERLPLCTHTNNETLIATTTQQAIESGVMNGALFEVEGYVNRLRQEYDDLAVIFTGGCAEYFAEKFKNTIFVNYELVIIGLNRILNHNADKK